MMGTGNLTLSHPGKTVSGTVQLTGSKSESNRALIIQALGNGKVEIQNLSAAADTTTLREGLLLAGKVAGNEKIVVDIGPAGTAMRFLSAFLAITKGNFLLTGSERMKQRPIGILVDALKKLGATIQYTETEGYPPLAIHGPLDQRTCEICIKGGVSSQYLSALLLIAPSLPTGLKLRIEGELTSRPYVSMTLNMLAEAGITYQWEQNTIHIQPQQAQPCTIRIEPDWSAASYWYAIVALSNRGRIILPGLKANSLQGDIAIVDIMSHFGVATAFKQDGVHIEKVDSHSDKKLFDFNTCPDLAQTVIVCAAALKRNLSFTGLHTLRIKETDRIAALQQELGKLGVVLTETDGTYRLNTDSFRKTNGLSFETYEDHRMAMAFASLAPVFDDISIANPSVVEKSYPDFWKHLKQQGFILS